jgi:hypothetical protein
MPVRLENIAEYQYIPVPEYRWILYGMIGAKLIACLYLVLLILRYYLFSGYLAFINMPALFPSAHEPEAPRSVPKPLGTAPPSLDSETAYIDNPSQAVPPPGDNSVREER